MCILAFAGLKYFIAGSIPVPAGTVCGQHQSSSQSHMAIRMRKGTSILHFEKKIYILNTSAVTSTNFGRRGTHLCIKLRDTPAAREPYGCCALYTW